MTKMPYHIITLDKRYTGREAFKYMIEDFTDGDFMIFAPSYSKTEKLKKFITLRNWCWETWGPSCERDYHLSMKHNKDNDMLNKHWCWYSIGYQRRIYLAGDEEKVWLKLKWD